MNHVYGVEQIHIKDPESWADYCNKVPTTLEPWDAELMLRGKKETTFSREKPYKNIFDIHFPYIIPLKLRITPGLIRLCSIQRNCS